MGAPIKFDDGVCIFREGERAEATFLLLSGQIEILKKTSDDFIQLELLSSGEVFGQIDVVDSYKRSVTARALGEVLVQVLGPQTSQELRVDEEDAKKQVNSLTDSLKSYGQSLVTADSRKILDEARDKKGVWGLIGGLIARRRNKNRVLQIGIGTLIGDNLGANSERLFKVLNTPLELNATIFSNVEQNYGDQNLFENIQNFSLNGRGVLIKKDADLLLFGRVEEISNNLNIHFLSRKMGEDRAGEFLVSDRLPLPANYSELYEKLIVLSVISAIVPRSEASRLMVHANLMSNMNTVEEFDEIIAGVIGDLDKSAIQVCIGNILSTLGSNTGDEKWYNEAEKLYKSATKVNDKDSMEFANASFHYGRLVHMLGERKRSVSLIKSALQNYTDASRILTKNKFPWEWSLLQNRMGTAYYRLDVLEGSIENIKPSVFCFQAALTIISKKVDPIKWSEIKNNLAQTLQIWGDMAGSNETVELAIKCCNEALEVRTRNETPLSWAATQNNLGSAQFLLGRKLRDKNLIEDSLKSLNKALEIYEIYGAKRLAQITTRNLNKSRRQLSSIDSEKNNAISLERGAEILNMEDVDGSARHLTSPMDQKSL